MYTLQYSKGGGGGVTLKYLFEKLSRGRYPIFSMNKLTQRRLIIGEGGWVVGLKYCIVGLESYLNVMHGFIMDLNGPNDEKYISSC